MTVSAQPATSSPGAATVLDVDLRRATDVPAGTFGWEGPDADTGWHRHPYHQIEYALEGVAEVTTADGRYLLPSQQAIWIPAGLPHATTLRRVRSVAAFFAPDLVDRAGDRALVIGVSPLLREMLLHGLRWPIQRSRTDRPADAFFEALAGVVADALEDERPLCLPASGDPVVAGAIAYVDAHLAEADLAGACRAAASSERSLRRRFAEELGMSWSEYLLRARILRAVALLSGDDRRSVVDIGNAVGFTSPSAFARAFRQVCGETPSAYRRRVADGAGPVIRT